MDKQYYVAEATRTDQAGICKKLMINLFGHKFIERQQSELVVLSIYRGECYFLKRIRLGK